MQTPDATGTPDDHERVAARMRALMVRAPLAVAFTSAGRFEVASEQFNHLFGHGDDTDLSGTEVSAVGVSEAAHQALQARLGAAFGGGRPIDDEVEFVRRDGSRFWGRLQASPVHWEQPAGEAMWVVEDITAARAQRLQPTWSAKHDVVTELANRREIERRLADHVGSRRHEPVSVLFIDIDKFGAVIQGMGIEVADHFLYGLGQMLVTKVRASDIVARLDNDHFAVLLPDCDQHYAQIVAEKVRASVAGYRLRWGLHRTRVKASVGVVQLQPSLDTVESVLAAAGLACAEAKAAGGDSVRVFVSNGTFEELAGA
ncbi:PAS domain S-box-containing protein/diguanylate cyclase (GGDEF) domain-containing protein [Roseateles sp. YR242]|uniref:GGDEF domain-containing protein n=1 Tax=Roseateles sp. YR242 TaxID=1855305 RepID=UPI0008CCDB1F|nr:sensor domain-containing diguanylate cyclase [Roseateles sp. YR242]SEL67188.1 PAS domain S-box-containing protein/diguanylate cyclase (GGDEF) domain-containing protein [Roseateles sp. YR242]